MRKWLLAGAALVAVLMVIIYSGVTHLGPLIKTAINTYGPQITRTTVDVGDVGLSLFAGEVRLKDFLLGNPQGFSAPEAVKAGSIDVGLDEKTLTGNPVVIDKVEVRAPEITYEKSAAGDNFQALLENVRQAAGAGQGAADTRLVIRRFIIRDGRINLTAAALAGRHVTTDMPYVEIQNLGGRKGAAPAQVATEVLTAVYRQIQSPDVTAALVQGVEMLGVEVPGIQIKAPLPQAAQEQAQAVKDAAKRLSGD